MKIKHILMAAVMSVIMCTNTYASSIQPSNTVTYNGNLTTNRQDFFADINNINWVPGDVFIDDISLINNKSSDINIYFWTEDINDEKEKDLINQMDMTIYNGNGVIFNDKLGTIISENNAINLGLIKGNSKENLSFKIEMPTSLTNEYSNMKVDIKWWFGVTDMGSTPSNASPGISGGSSGSHPSVIKPNTQKPEDKPSINPDSNPIIDKVTSLTTLPKTGEETNLLLIRFLIGLTFLAGSMIFLFCKKEDKKHEV